MEDDLTICDWWVLREKLGEDSEENSSVALLSPACFPNSNPPTGPPTHPSHRISLLRPFLSNHSSDLPQILNLGLGDRNWRLFEWRRPPLEDDLKILKVEYLSNHWSDLPQMLNLCLGDHTKMEKNLEMKRTSYGRRPQNIKSWISLIGPPSNFKLKLRGQYHNQKFLKVEYLSNHWWFLPQILRLSLGDQFMNWGRHPMKVDLKTLKVEYLSNCWLDLPQILKSSFGDHISK